MIIDIKDGNKIVENFVACYNGLVNVLHNVDGWQKRDTKVINEFIRQVPMLLSLVEGKPVEVVIPFEGDTREEVLQAWQLWKQHLASCDVYYSPYAERAAINYICRLTGFDARNFVFVLEYAMASGYTKINPEILVYAIPSQKPMVKNLFKDSVYNDFTQFKQQFGEAYNNVDLKYYYDKVYHWSNSQGRLSADWISTAKGFMQKDARESNLACLNSKKKQVTEKSILGTVMQAQNLLNRHFGFIRTLPEGFWKNLKAKSLLEQKLVIEFDIAKSGLSEKQCIEYGQQLTDYINKNEPERIHIHFETK